MADFINHTVSLPSLWGRGRGRGFSLYLIILCTALAACSSRPADEDGGTTAAPRISANLSNQKIQAIAEDEQGHIWIGTFRGLNKYDGHEYRQYFCTDDSLSLPDNQIQDILRDSRGRLWVSTVNGVCRYTDQDDFHPIPIHADNRNAIQLFENREGRVFINTMFQLYAYDEEKDSFEDCHIEGYNPYSLVPARCHVNSMNEMWDVNGYYLNCYDASTLQRKDSVFLGGWYAQASCMDKEDCIWMAGYQRVVRYDTRTRRFADLPDSLNRHPLLSQTSINLVHPYADGLLLSSNEHGLFYLDAAEGTVIHQDENGFPFEAPRFYIQNLFTDSHGNLWIGSIDQGYTVCYRYKERFNSNNYLRRQLEGKSVVSLTTDHEQRLWISTLMDGLYVYDPGNQDIRHIDLLPTGKKGFCWLYIDRDDYLWVTSGVHKLLKCRYLPEAGRLRVEQTYEMPMPMNIVQTNDGTVWVSTATQYIFYLRPDAREFRPLQVYMQGYTFIPTLLPLETGRLLVAGFGHKMVEVDVQTLEMREVSVSEEDYADCIRRSVAIPTVLYRPRRSEDIYVGTVSNGLLRYTPSTERMQPVEGIPCNDISSIEEDAEGHLWVGTQYGLNCYDPTEERFTYYDATDGIGGNQFYDRASCRMSDGTLVFGGTHGLTFFHPGEALGGRKFPLLFENLKIHNRLVMPQTGGCIDRHLSYCPDIHLRHDQNSISLSFAALDYGEHTRFNYQYKLEGFDRDWIEAGHNHEAYYGNLFPGHYTFRLRASQTGHSEILAESELNLSVSPAPWLSVPAVLFYLLVVAGIVYLLYRGWRRIQKEREAARQARIAKEQEQRVNKMNMSFFANISHEFRTPLTMIAGPVAQLGQSPDVKGSNKQLLAIVQHSVSRMLRLVNQLMDFNKLENDTLRLRVRRADVMEVLRRSVAIFQVNAEEKRITFTTYGLEDSCLFLLDEDKIEKIATNLMSNAMKFTPQGGEIEVRFDLIGQEKARQLVASSSSLPDNSQYMLLEVADSGQGIPEDQQERIFERYYQMDNQNGGTYNWGTGIGLYYARALARLHHGYLWASNRKECSGSLFSLLIPTDDAAYSEEERTHASEKQEEAFPLSVLIKSPQEVNQAARSQKTAVGKEGYCILIVDDDTEVIHYLNALLSPHYRTLCSFSADAAIETMGKQLPDLVISDVVMPGKSGYDLCRQIKDNLQLCHIPVILVTARTTVESQIEGLNTGADAYVTKPFEPEYLLALIKSLLDNREKVKALLSRSTHTDTMQENQLSPQDNAFMTELYRLMENELSNPELDITSLTNMLHISRTKFYYKVKGLTGESPSTFFKTYKLNRAAELLKEGRYTVSEIADMTGFSTLSHFSTSFKRQFGVIPSEYPCDS